MSLKAIGKYVDLERIGHGGMAEVYLGRDPHLDRRVAIKVILPHLGLEETFEERFRQEAKLVAYLRHPNIIQIYEFDFHENQPYMVMEFLAGGTMKEVLTQSKSRRETMALGEIARLLAVLANALDFAHEHGAVHRDIKPSNIMFSMTGAPIIVDFGVAKILNTSFQLTGTGGIVGSPPYMSPEQAASQPVEKFSDIYSLGIVIYELATGRVPFVGDTVSGVLMQHLTNPPPPPREFNPNIPLPVQAVIAKALAKEPQARYPSAGEFAQAFDQALRGGGTLTQISLEDETEVAVPREVETGPGVQPVRLGDSSPLAAREPRGVKKRAALPIIILVGFLALVGLLGVFILSWGPALVGNLSGSGAAGNPAGQVLLHASLDNEEAIRHPETGLGGYFALQPDDFVPGRENNGVLFVRGGESCEDIDFQEVVFPAWRGEASNVDLEAGELTFWYQPRYNSNDAEGVYDIISITIDGSSPSSIYLSFDEGYFNFVVVDAQGEWLQASTSYRTSLWKSGEWVSVRAVWDTYDAADSLRLYVNELRADLEKVPGGWQMDEEADTATRIFVGSGAYCGENPANGIIDELTIRHFP